MKKDREWAFMELGKLFPTYTEMCDGPDNITVMKCELLNKVYDILSQLDEPEVLSQEWIDNNSINASHDGVTEEYVHFVDLKNLIIPKQELPVIPKYVADWIYDLKSKRINLLESIYDFNQYEDINNYMREQGNVLMRAWLDGFTIASEEEELLYYALVKGHELIVDEDDNKYWNCDVSNNDVFPSNRFSQHGRYLTELSQSKWNELGINDSNADFVKVDDC